MAYMTILPQTCHQGGGRGDEGLYCRHHNHNIHTIIHKKSL